MRPGIACVVASCIQDAALTEVCASRPLAVAIAALVAAVHLDRFALDFENMP